MDFMRRNIFLVLIILVPLVSSCDLFRSLAGRPTSKDIEIKRQEIIQHQANLEKAKQDSIALVQKAETDSLAAIAALSKWIYPSSRMRGLADDANLSHRYYVIIGGYRVKENAEAVVKQVSEVGYHVDLVKFNNNIYAIALSPSNKIADAYGAYLKITKEQFCPEGAWILLNE